MESKVIVIHHGSHSLKIGLASDSSPKTIPNYIARKRKESPPPTTTKDENNKTDNDNITQATTTTTPPVSMDIDSKPTPTTPSTISTPTPIPTKIQVPKKLLEEVELSVKETTKLLPPVDYIKVRQKPILYNENNSMTFELIKKKKKKSSNTTAPNSTSTTTQYTPPQLNYNEIDYCIGDDAITVSRDKNKWISYQPIIMSTFNSGIYNSVQSMYDDITQMWKYAIQRYLNIPSSDLSSYGCVYVVTDNIDKKSLKQITTLLLKELQFTSVLLFQESICSTFGVSMSSQACVVDIGHQKISIACIDEGYLLPNTRISLKYGGEQLTKLLEYLLTGMDRETTGSGRSSTSKQFHKYYFPFKSNENETVDFSPFYQSVFDNIKIDNLDYNYNDIQKQRVGTFKVKDIKQEKHLNTYHFNADEVYQLVGMSLFYPNVLTQFGGSSINYVLKSDTLLSSKDKNSSNIISVEYQKHYYNYYISSFDYEDPFDNSSSSNKDGYNNNSSTSTSPTKKLKSNSVNNEVDLALDVAITKSVSLLERSDINKKKYLSNILLVGGGSLAPGIQDVLKARIFKQLEQQQQQQQQQKQQQQQQQLQNSTNSTPININQALLENYIGFAGSSTIRTDVDSRHASWRGGAILGCLESTREIWITRSEWQDGKNSSALNKLPF